MVLQQKMILADRPKAAKKIKPTQVEESDVEKSLNSVDLTNSPNPSQKFVYARKPDQKLEFTFKPLAFKSPTNQAVVKKPINLNQKREFAPL